MRVLVTGACGLVGRYVVDELAQHHSVEMLDIKPQHRRDLPFHKVNILEEQEVRKVLIGFDAVVHLAGIPHPLNEPPEEVFKVNTVGTYNILEACAVHRITKFIFMSSESTLGFAFSKTPIAPIYIPIDEEHPLNPQDAYGLSKVCCELLCAGFTRRVGMRSICLRAPWIWVNEEKEVQIYRDLIKDYKSWYKNLWAYIHVLDAAQAINRALEFEGIQLHETFFVCADDNWTGHDSIKLLKEFYPQVEDIRDGFNGRMSLISALKAKHNLGFSPKYNVRDILDRR